MGFNNNNDDDFDFDDDLFADDDDPFADDDLFGAEDDDLFADGGDAFAFEEDEFDAGNFEDVDIGLPSDEEIQFEEQQEGGASGAFRTSLFVLVPLLLVQIGVILFLFLRPTGPTPIQQTATAISATNVVIGQTATSNFLTQQALSITQTFEASFTDTPTVTPTEDATDTATPTESPTPSDTPDPTLQAVLTLDAEETAAALALTSAAETEAALPTDTPPGGLTNAERDATATALVQLFESLTQTAEARGGTAVLPMDTPAPDQPTATPSMPDSGFFDNTPTGGSLGMLVLTAFGLLGVIAFSRRLRAQNRELD